MKRRVIFFLIIVNFLPTFAQETILRGKVTSKSRTGDPIALVQISAAGANPTTSDSFGRFELIFSQKKPGEQVNIIVKKKDMEIVNREGLEHFVLRSNPDDLLVIVLCPKGKRSKYAIDYYNIDYYNIVFKSYIDKINEIEKEKQSAKIENVNELQNQIDELKKDWVDNQKLIKELTEKLATLKLEGADSLVSKVLEILSVENIDKVHEMLDKKRSPPVVFDAWTIGLGAGSLTCAGSYFYCDHIAQNKLNEVSALLTLQKVQDWSDYMKWKTRTDMLALTSIHSGLSALSCIYLFNKSSNHLLYFTLHSLSLAGFLTYGSIALDKANGVEQDLNSRYSDLSADRVKYTGEYQKYKERAKFFFINAAVDAIMILKSIFYDDENSTISDNMKFHTGSLGDKSFYFDLVTTNRINSEIYIVLTKYF